MTNTARRTTDKLQRAQPACKGKRAQRANSQPEQVASAARSQRNTKGSSSKNKNSSTKSTGYESCNDHISEKDSSHSVRNNRHLPEGFAHVQFDGKKNVFVDTGEAVGSAVVAIPKRTSPYEGGFSMASSTMLKTLAKKDFAGSDLRVLMYIIGSMEFGNRLTTTASGIARELGLTRESVGTALRRLEEQDIVTTLARVGNARVLELHENVAWRGRTSHKWEREAERRQRGCGSAQRPNLTVIDGGVA